MDIHMSNRVKSSKKLSLYIWISSYYPYKVPIFLIFQDFIGNPYILLKYAQMLAIYFVWIAYGTNQLAPVEYKADSKIGVERNAKIRSNATRSEQI